MNLPGDPWLFFAQTLFVAVLVIAMARTARFNGEPLKGARGMQMLGAVTALCICAMAASDPATHLLEAAVRRPVLATSGGVFLGTALYLMRRTNRTFYGALEVAFSVATFVQLARHSGTNPATATVPFLGAVYVFVRGLSNIEDGWRSRPAPETRVADLSNPPGAS